MDTFEKFYNKSLRYLSYRPRSEKEIRDYIKKCAKDLDSSITEKIISKLKEYNFLNDENFAKLWIEQRTNFKPKSLRVIKMELAQKGIKKELIEDMIYDLRFKNKDLESVKKLIEKRITRYENLEKQEIYEKLGRFLAGKGFDYDTIKEALSRFR